MKYLLTAAARCALCGLILTTAPAPAVAQEQGAGPMGEPLTEVRVTDLTPRFLAFYEAALAEGADEARRWELWKERYDFAAVPPVPERDSLAREMLASAWPRYPDMLDRIRSGAEGIEPAPDSLLREVAARLHADEPIRVNLLAFVGDGESGAFFTASDGRLTVAVPIEEPVARRQRGLAHEFTHAVHHELAGLSEGWERSVARTLFAEGLANRMEQAVFPGLTEAEYIEHRPGWLAEAEAVGDEILRGMLPYLRESTSEHVARFTIGTGTTGLEREAYYAGWVVVGHLLSRGHALAELARIPESRIPEVVEAAMRAIVASAPAPDDSSARAGAASPGGVWEGAARTPAGPLGMSVDLQPRDGAWTAVFAVPAEGVEVPVSEVRIDGDSIVLNIVTGRVLRGELMGDSIAGTLEIGGRGMPVVLGRAGTATARRLMGAVEAAAEAARPAPLVRTGGGMEGVDAAALDRLVAAADSAHSHALVVLRDGRLVGAWYAGGERRMIETMSVTKSVLNLAIGRLVTTGAIESLDEPVHTYYPEWSEGEKSAITVRHLLNHTSGLHSPSPTTPIYESDDFVQFALDAELVASPGTELLYNNNATNLLAGVAGRAAGERLDRFLRDDLFARLGITDFRWSLDGAGNPHGMSGAQMHAEDLARLGQLVLQRGEWDGEPLIDPEWFDESLVPGSELSDGVGLLWWLIREDDEIIGYRADGYLGQYLVIYPDQGLVAVRMVAQTPAYDPETDGFRDFQALVRELVPVGEVLE